MTDIHVSATRARLLRHIDDAIDILHPLAAADGWRQSLCDLREQLHGRRHQVAVFGAFSTGKSSLINAVVKSPVLVVSPNPTTAAITHIYGTADNSFAAARVTAKSAEQLWDDVKQSLLALHLAEDNIEAALQRAAALKPTDYTPMSRRYITFLKSVANGYGEMRNRLGTSWEVGPDELKKYTAEERYACFVQRVDLFTKAPLLQETGMVLVDTPGIDSIHRRHTDVAFQYMQSADAIVFVLYYTHAFSRADKEFLSQLADVQDIAGTDKLFVVINAVDLAENEEERSAVRKRVVKELRQLGIRAPRVYEVSSQLAFAAAAYQENPEDTRYSELIRHKLRVPQDSELSAAFALEQSGLPQLEADLRAFLATQEDVLAEDAVRRRLSSIADAVRRQVAMLKIQAQQNEVDAAERKRTAAVLSRTLDGVRDAVLQGVDPVMRGLNAEWDELVFHVGERIRIRFGQLFKECFHPGRFRVSSQDKQSLQDAAAELAEVLSRTVEAEMRTFGLRAHRHVIEALQSRRAEWANSLAQAGLTYVALPADPSRSLSLPELPERVNLDGHRFRPAFRHFTSAKQFFEGHGQSAMQAALEPIALEAVREAIQRLSQSIRASMLQTLTEILTRWIEELQGNLSDSLLESPSTDDMNLWLRAEAWFTPYMTA
jgi:GTPase Era involved in 16S rRNA processing